MMSENNEYDEPGWLGPTDRIIFNLIRPVYTLNFSLDHLFPYDPSIYKNDDDIDLPSLNENSGSSFLLELQDGNSEFHLKDLNENYAIKALNPHILTEIAHLYDISKITKFEIESTNIISFISPDLFQPIKDNLSEIKFDDCYLTDLPKGIFKNLHLKFLSFFNCSFGKLSEDFGLDDVGSVDRLVLYDNVYSNNIDIRPQLKILEKSGTDVVFKSPLDPKDKALEDKLNRIFPFEL
ncbi:MAG: hypothetical protein HeimC2_34330 [Candidatus Heimdallarchaeota archaeon LC_2]|nr:MAG: hypothetical protein HeimC2_34330 [Candidatus Heimdallarchaeota archaeon LC_2]